MGFDAVLQIIAPSASLKGALGLSFCRNGEVNNFVSMATTLQNNLLDFYFSSQLPDLRWQTDEEAITVSLYCPDGSVGHILELTLTAVGGYVDLMEVRDAVERKMRYLNKSQIFLQVQWKVPSARIYNISGGCNVYYCTQDIVGSCSAWIEAHFLTTIDSKPLPGNNETEFLSFVNLSTVAIKPLVSATCRLSTGAVRVVTLDDYCAAIDANTPLIQRISWNIDDLHAAAVEAEPTVEEVLAVAISVGARTMTYYKPAIPANAAFVFKNGFGVLETAWLNCVTTTKTKDGRKMAQVARRATLYDIDVTVTHEVETAPLPLKVASWLSQLVTSPEAWIAGKPILVTDGETSISDDAAVMNTVKFTWQRDDARDDISIAAADVDIFVKPPFSHQFD